MKSVRFFSILITLSFLGNQATGQFVPEKEISKTENYVPYQEMKITVTDVSTGDPFITDIYVNGIHPRKTTVLKSLSDTIFEIKNYRLYSVSCNEKGYMYYTEKFWPDEKMIHLQKVVEHEVNLYENTMFSPLCHFLLVSFLPHSLH